MDSDNLSNLIKSSSSGNNLLENLKLTPQSLNGDSNVSNLINDIENYFEETNSSVLQILRSHTGIDEFETFRDIKSIEEVNDLLDQGCEVYMLPKNDII
jgi:hypothetical protein